MNESANTSQSKGTTINFIAQTKYSSDNIAGIINYRNELEKSIQSISKDISIITENLTNATKNSYDITSNLEKFTTIKEDASKSIAASKEKLEEANNKKNELDNFIAESNRFLKIATDKLNQFIQLITNGTFLQYVNNDDEKSTNFKDLITRINFEGLLKEINNIKSIPNIDNIINSILEYIKRIKSESGTSYDDLLEGVKQNIINPLSDLLSTIKGEVDKAKEKMNSIYVEINEINTQIERLKYNIELHQTELLHIEGQLKTASAMLEKINIKKNEAEGIKKKLKETKTNIDNLIKQIIGTLNVDFSNFNEIAGNYSDKCKDTTKNINDKTEEKDKISSAYDEYNNYSKILLELKTQHDIINGKIIALDITQDITQIDENYSKGINDCIKGLLEIISTNFNLLVELFNDKYNLFIKEKEKYEQNNNSIKDKLKDEKNVITVLNLQKTININKTNIETYKKDATEMYKLIKSSENSLTTDDKLKISAIETKYKEDIENFVADTTELNKLIEEYKIKILKLASNAKNVGLEEYTEVCNEIKNNIESLNIILYNIDSTIKITSECDEFLILLKIDNIITTDITLEQAKNKNVHIKNLIKKLETINSLLKEKCLKLTDLSEEINQNNSEYYHSINNESKDIGNAFQQTKNCPQRGYEDQCDNILAFKIYNTNIKLNKSYNDIATFFTNIDEAVNQHNKAVSFIKRIEKHLDYLTKLQDNLKKKIEELTNKETQKKKLIEEKNRLIEKLNENAKKIKLLYDDTINKNLDKQEDYEGIINNYNCSKNIYEEMMELILNINEYDKKIKNLDTSYVPPENNEILLTNAYDIIINHEKIKLSIELIKKKNI